MPIRSIQRKPSPFLHRVNGEAADIGIDSDSEELKYVGNPSGTATVYVVLPKLPISVPVTASSADQTVFIADANYIVTGINFVVNAQGGASAAVVPRKCTGTTVIASGTSLLSSGSLNLQSTTVDTVTAATLTGTAATLALAAGDRLVLDFSGTLTSLVGNVTFYLRRAE